MHLFSFARKTVVIIVSVLFAATLVMWLEAAPDKKTVENKTQKKEDDKKNAEPLPPIKSNTNALERDMIEKKIEEGEDYLILGDTKLYFYHIKFKSADILSKYLISLAGRPKRIFVYGKHTYKVKTIGAGNRTINHPADILIIEDTPQRIEYFKTVLKVIDIPKPQVLIEIRIIEINHTSEFHWGFKHNVDQSSVSEAFYTGYSLNYSPDSWLEAMPVSATSPFQGMNFTFASAGESLTRFGIANISIRMMEAKGNAEILSSPRLLIEEGSEGQIVSGESVFITDVDEPSPGNFTIRNIEKQIGIVMNIAVLIIGKKTVKLRLVPSVSEITGYTKPGRIAVSVPIISKRTIDTVTTIEGGKTLILGGLISTETSIKTRGIPIISDIPLIGELFKSHDRYKSKSEIMFVLTPKIIDVRNQEETVDPLSNK